MSGKYGIAGPIRWGWHDNLVIAQFETQGDRSLALGLWGRLDLEKAPPDNTQLIFRVKDASRTQGVERDTPDNKGTLTYEKGEQ